MLQVAQEYLTLSLTGHGFQDQPFNCELMEKENLACESLRDILRSRTIAAESSIKLAAITSKTPKPNIRTEPSKICLVYEDNRQDYHRLSRARGGDN